MTRLLLLLTFLLLLIGCSNPPEEPLPPDMQAIVDQGTIRIGIHAADFPPFSFHENNERKGFEIDITKALVDAVFGDTVTIEWVPTLIWRPTDGNRFDTLRGGKIDFYLRITHTISREEEAQWTVPYLLTGKQFMVKSDSGIDEWADLANETICYESDYETNLLNWSEVLGIPIEPMLIFNDVPFINGECAAILSDWSELMFSMHLYSSTHEEGNQWVTIGDLINQEGEIGYEPIALAIKPDAPGLHSAMNAALIEMINDGRLQAIYDEWLPEQPPWALEELLDVPPADR